MITVLEDQPSKDTMAHPSLPQNPLLIPGAQPPPSLRNTDIRISSSMRDQLADPTRPAGTSEPARSAERGRPLDHRALIGDVLRNVGLSSRCNLLRVSDLGYVPERKRRRSPSPFERRSPRPRHRSASRSSDRSRSPSPSAVLPTSFYTRAAHPVHSRGRQEQVPPPPGKVEHVLPFKQFTDWLRAAWPKMVYRDEDDRSGTAMGRRYEAYRRAYYHRQLVTLFLAHRESAWFIEHYSTSKTHVATRKRLNREGRVPRARAYLEALSRGDYDDVSYDQEVISVAEGSHQADSVHDDAGEPDEPREEQKEKNGHGHSNGNGHENGNAAGGDLDDRISMPPSSHQLFVKTIPPSASRKDLEKMFKSVDGLRYLAISEPSSKKSYHRVAWAQYAEGTDMGAAVLATDGQQIDSFTYHVVENQTPAIGRLRLTAPIANTLARLERDLELARELAKKLEAELQFDATIEGVGELEGLDGSVWEKVEERIMAIWMREGLEAEDILDDTARARRTRLALDQYLHYLRKGLNTCYYCVVPLAYGESLNRACIAHVRPREGTVAPEPEIEGRKTPDQRWVEALEAKICLLVDNGEEGDLQSFTKRHYEEEIRRICAPLIRQESANKYACTECHKMFKAPEYVIKHLPTKHRELMADVLEQIAYFHTFVLDPNKISPLAGQPAATSLAIPKPLYSQGHTHHPQPVGSNGRNSASIAQPMAHSHAAGAWNPAIFPAFANVPMRPVSSQPLLPAGNEDPRAKRGRVSYMDLDEGAGGGGGGGEQGLPY